MRACGAVVPRMNGHTKASLGRPGSLAGLCIHRRTPDLWKMKNHGDARRSSISN